MSKRLSFENKNFLRIFLLLFWVSALTIFGYLLYSRGVGFFDIQKIAFTHWYLAIGIFMAVHFFRPLLFVPDSILLVTGSAVFGPFYGWILGYLGEIFAALSAFWTARMFGRKVVEHTHQKFIHNLDKVLTKHGLLALITLRILPFVYFDLVSSAAGLSGMKFRTYIWANAIGLIPALTVFVFIGASITDPELLTPALIAVGLLGVAIVVIRMFKPDIFELGTHHYKKHTR